MATNLAEQPDIPVDGCDASRGASRPAADITAERARDLCAVLGLIAAVCAVFWRTIVSGQPLSKVGQIGLWDAAFAAITHGSSVSMDPSSVQLMIPYYLLVGRLWRQGELPLWNHYGACGSPLLADPQSTVFSLLHTVLIAWNCIRAYDLILVAELCILAIGMYLFTRELKVSRTGAMCAAASLTFCPWVSRNLELIGAGYVYMPLLFWSFARAARIRSFWSAVIASATASIFILSGHPEIYFFGIIFAALLLTVIVGASALGTEIRAISDRVKIAARLLSVSGVVAFCLSAPQLLPFIEFLKNSACYKFGDVSQNHIPWQALAVNLMQPAQGASSLYLGSIAFAGLAFCLSGSNNRTRIAWTILGLFALAEFVTARISPINELMRLSVFAPVIAAYCNAVALTLLAALSAIGLDNFVCGGQTNRLKFGVRLIAVAAAGVSIALSLRLAHADLGILDWDKTLSPALLGSHDWQRIAIATWATTMLLLSTLWVRGAKTMFVIVVALAISVFTQYQTMFEWIKAQAAFSYSSTELTDYLRSNHVQRIIATGDHLLKPNTAELYGISDFRAHNPMFTSRYLNFAKASGAQLDQYNQYFAAPFRPLLDAASIDTVVSQSPVWSASFDELAHRSPGIPINIGALGPLRPVKLQVAYDAANRHLIGSLQCDTTDKARELKYQWVLLDKRGTYWMSDAGDAGAFANSKSAGSETTIPCQVCFPKSLRDDGFYAIALRIFESSKSAHPGVQTIFDRQTTRPVLFFKPSSGKFFEQASPSAPVEINRAHDPRFALVYETREGIRVYRNEAALPSAYVVPHVVAANSDAEALEFLSLKNFDWRNYAVVDQAEISRIPVSLSADKIMHRKERLQPNEPPTQQTGIHKRIQRDVETITRNSNSSVGVTALCDRDSMLVLTDTFYPGWNVYVDGVRQHLVHANYLFRGVILKQGLHRVLFRFEPISFVSGLFLCGACLLCLALIASWRVFSMRRVRFAYGERSTHRE